MGELLEAFITVSVLVTFCVAVAWLLSRGDQ